MTKLFTNFLMLAFGLSIASCSQSSSPSPSNLVVAEKSSPTPISTSSPSEEQKGEYLGFAYFFKKEGEKTVALFVPRFLPRDDKIFLGATQDVISRSYKEKISSDARLVDSNAGGKTTRVIRVDSKTHGYIVLPVKEDTGEIHSLVITQVGL